MSKTYIIADAHFCDVVAAQNHHMSVDEYNNAIIENTNKTITPNDTIIFIGDIGSYENKDIIKDCIARLAAKTKKCIDMRLQPSFNTREKMEEIGIERAYTIDGFTKGEVYGQGYFVTITSDYNYYSQFFNQPSEDGIDRYYAMPASALNRVGLEYKELLQDKCFNISIGAWDLCPMDYESIITNIDNMRVFNSMEDEEHESTI